jgi:hypothetical protein
VPSSSFPSALPESRRWRCKVSTFAPRSRNEDDEDDDDEEDNDDVDGMTSAEADEGATPLASTSSSTSMPEEEAE